MPSAYAHCVVTRRELLAGGAGAAGGVVASAAAAAGWTAYDNSRPLPYYGSAVSGIRPDLTGPGVDSGRVHWWGRRDRPQIALTFDDGPHPQWTPDVVATLDRLEVPATFFVTGVNVRDHWSILAAAADRHEIGNHSFDHPDLGRLAYDDVTTQLARCTEAIGEHWGKAPRLFRPPYGHLGGSTMLAAAEQGLELVLWSAQMKEASFVDRPDDLVADITAAAAPGVIILAHDTGPQERLITIKRLDRIVKSLQDNGFTFATVSQILA